MMPRWLVGLAMAGFVAGWAMPVLAQDDQGAGNQGSQDQPTAAPETAPKEPEAAPKEPEATPQESEAAPKEPEVRWPYQEPLFALSAQPQSRIRLGTGFAYSPDAESLAFVLEGSFAFSRFGVHLLLPLGLAMMGDAGGNAFTYGDVQFGGQWLISYDQETNKHLTVGLDVVAPTSRIGEKSDAAAVQVGAKDATNFGQRFMLAQKPFLDIGLIPKLNIGFVPYVAFGQNLGRVSLQTDFGCLMLIMDNVSEKVYGTDRRYGFILFYDLAAPVAITQELSIVSEFNATVALGGLVGTGFAITVGPRYRVSGFSAGLGVQIPIGVDNKPPDDDKMLGRYDAALYARHQIAGILDLSYTF